MKVEIVEGKRRHCGPMARMMRVEHDAALRRRGVNLHHAIKEKYDQSYYCRTAFVDDHIAGMWGLCGSPLASDGMVWLVVAQHVIRHRRKIVEVARAELAKMAEHKVCLGTTVLPDDGRACRFAEFLGFDLADGGYALEGGQIPIVYRPEKAS
jgi:hypothetical protein